MKIHELTLTSKTARKRLGRGIGSGTGKTSGRGTKGQNARTGGGVRPGFAGGQNPLAKLLPKKRGFKPHNTTVYAPVNVSGLAKFKAGSTVELSDLVAAGLINRADARVKLLGHGEIKHKLTVKVHAASVSAVAAVEAAGGSVQLLDMPRLKSKQATRPAAEPAPAKPAAKTPAKRTPKAAN